LRAERDRPQDPSLVSSRRVVRRRPSAAVTSEGYPSLRCPGLRRPRRLLSALLSATPELPEPLPPRITELQGVDQQRRRSTLRYSRYTPALTGRSGTDLACHRAADVG
jgi:hypothetical protein